MSAAAARPIVGTPRPFAFPFFTRKKLDNGLQVVVAPVARLPVCSIVVVTDAGAEREAAGSEGLARMTARMLLEGTRRWTAAEVTERLERIGASAVADADWDCSTLAVSFLSERLPAALEVVAEILTSPAFPADELERLRAERLAELQQLRHEPRGLADEVLSRVIYSGDSRYAHPLGGAEASVQSLSGEDLQRFHSRWYTPGRTTVIVAGDVADTVFELVGRVLGEWGAPPGSGQARRGSPAPPAARIHLVDRPNAPQSEIRIGKPGAARSHPDYFPLTVMNSILGGVFSSRINLNLREEHAYTYGAHSAFEWRRGDGPFSIDTAVESGVTAPAVREILREVERIGSEPPTEQELSLVRDYLIGVFPIRFETSAAIAAALAQLVIHDLAADYYDRYRDRVAAVTADHVVRAARTHLDPGALRIIVVGDAARVRTALSELGDVADAALR